MLLTRSRLCPGASPGSSLHLHVLSTPPAFVLSQDQTLREELLTQSCRASHEGAAVHRGKSGRIDGVLLYCLISGLTARPEPSARVEPGRTLNRPMCGPNGAHAVEFSKTVAPWGGDSARQTPPSHEKGLRRGPTLRSACGGKLGAGRLRGLDHPKGRESIALPRRNVSATSQISPSAPRRGS